jgi:YVTN family beta-propeller protein
VSLDQATDTVCVANWGNGKGTTVSVIDGRTCNGQVTSGCGKIPATVTIGTAPAGMIVDEPADTVYTGTVAPGGAEAIWVIDGATCNATTTSGCRQKPASVTVGAGSADYNVAFAIDQATQTLYVANWKNNTLSVIDTATCNATTTSGCARTPHATQVGTGPDGIALNLATDTLYASNVTSDTVSVLDAACNAAVSSGCRTQQSRSLPTGQAPQSVTLDQATDLVYASSMVVLYAARHRVPVPSLGRCLLWLGIAATLTANMAQGWSHGTVGAVVAAWPAVSLVGSYELLVWLIRTSGARRNAGRRQNTSAIVRYVVLRFVPSRSRPLTAIAPAGASATRQTRRGGPQVRPPGCRPSPPTSSVTMRHLKPAPSMTRRWPRTGSACRPAIRCRNAGWLACSDARPAAGSERESLTHDKHHRSRNRRAPRPWLNCRRWRANSEQ